MQPIKGNTYVILWSPHQQVFHVETVNEMLKTNVDVYINGVVGGDYIVLGFEASHEAADKTIEELKAGRAKMEEEVGGMDRGRALAKLDSAAQAIMTGWGELPGRVQKAHNDLLEFAGCKEFEGPAEEILSNLSTPGGDWSKVTKQQYLNVAGAVHHYLTQLR